MPGIDYSLLKREIQIAQVLDLLDYVPTRTIGFAAHARFMDPLPLGVARLQ